MSAYPKCAECKRPAAYLDECHNRLVCAASATFLRRTHRLVPVQVAAPAA